MATVNTNALMWGAGLGVVYILAPKADEALGTQGKTYSVKNISEIGAPIIGVAMQAMNFRPEWGRHLTAAGTARAVQLLYEMATSAPASRMSSARSPAIALSARVAPRQPADVSAGGFDVR